MALVFGKSKKIRLALKFSLSIIKFQGSMQFLGNVEPNGHIEGQG
jgi:hypothetical protein